MTKEKRFDQLAMGDVIYWRGAEGDRAVVTWIGVVDRSVSIRWDYTAENRERLGRAAGETTLRWRPNDPVQLSEVESG
jgi:hypothetical protein